MQLMMAEYCRESHRRNHRADALAAAQQRQAVYCGLNTAKVPRSPQDAGHQLIGAEAAKPARRGDLARNGRAFNELSRRIGERCLRRLAQPRSGDKPDRPLGGFAPGRKRGEERSAARLRGRHAACPKLVLWAGSLALGIVGPLTI